MTLVQRIKQVYGKPVVVKALTLTGFFVYLVQTVYFSYTQMSMIDEGLFLYKGYLFATGIYRPYQDYGPWMQKAPFAYLIPGYIQAWFGPSLRVGRYFVVLISILTLIGLWYVAKRLGGSWWAAMAVWAMALNPQIIKFYSVSSSEPLTACLLLWTFFFTLGDDRPVWQLGLGTFLASVLVLTRQNMMPLLPLLWVYIFWQYDHRKFVWSVLVSLILFLIVHWLYWPGILRLWAPWLPAQLTPFLNPWRAPQGISASWNSPPQFLVQLISFFSGFRFHFIALNGGIAALLFWPSKTIWKSRSDHRSGVFLAVLFVVLLGVHVWAGTGNEAANSYNSLSFTPYLSFFVPMGILLLIISAPAWKSRIKIWRQALVVFLVLAISTGIGYSSYQVHGFAMIEMPVPRVRNFFHTWRFLPGTTELKRFLANKYGLDFATSRWLVPTLLGFGIGLVVLAVGLVVWMVLRRRKAGAIYSLGAIIMATFLVVGATLSPTHILGADYTYYDCGTNVVQRFEEVGRELSQIIPPASTVYWDGGNAVSILLYLPGIHIFPQQLDEFWSYWVGGNDDDLARYGFWNDNLMREWREESDFIIIQQTYFTTDWKEFLESGNYLELTSDHIVLGCHADTYLRIFSK
jgi:hypothetical protein